MSIHDTDAVCTLLRKGMTYEQVAASTGRSKGSVWRVARAAGARKHEDRIQHRERGRADAAQRLSLLEARIAEMGTTQAIDVLEGLRTLPDDTYQVICTSPPYNIGRAYGGDPRADRTAHLAYRGWLLQVISELSRVLRPGGVLALQVGATKLDNGQLMPLDVILWQYLEMAGLTAQSRVVWPSTHGLTPKRRLAERYETIMVFSKGEPSVWNPCVARTPQRNPGKRAFHGPRKGQLTCHPLGAAPTNIWDDIPHVAHNRGHLGHPAQFSEELARRIILLWSLPVQKILDPFCGSGTTQVAAFETGREFDGFDLHYADIRDNRIRDAVPDRVSVFPGVSQENAAVWEAEARRVSIEAQMLPLG